MPEQHIRIIESLAGNVMDQLGYERYLVESGMEEKFSKQDIEQFSAENDKGMKSMSKRTDPNDLKRRQQQLNIIKEIRDFSSRSPLPHTALS